MARILIIEDEVPLRFSIRHALSKLGHEITEAETQDDGLQAAQATEPELILSDIHLGKGNGLKLLAKLREAGNTSTVILMTAFASIDTAVEALKLGADDYLAKPFDLDELVLTVERHLAHRKDRSRLRLYERLDASRQSLPGSESPMIGESEAWKRVVQLADRLAAVPLPAGQKSRARSIGAALPTMLILGPTGTGKGVLARYIHEQASQIAQQGSAAAGAGVAGGAGATSGAAIPPFVHVNCSALAPSLIESELFGHEKGAFTDAKGLRPGLFELAEGGTIFLDEIGDMPLELQAKILTIVEDGTYRRVGGTNEHRVRARLVAATNHDLEQRVKQGTFRGDLFYRLSAFTLHLPALQERGEDVVLMARSMLDQFAREYGRRGLVFSAEAERMLRAHDWPGNVRELVNVVQRAAMLSMGTTVEPVDLALRPRDAGTAADMTAARGDVSVIAEVRGESAAPRVATGAGEAASATPGMLKFDFKHGIHTARDVERELMFQALQYTNGNVSRAARLIGMQRSSFRKRIDRFKKQGIAIPVFEMEPHS